MSFYISFLGGLSCKLYDDLNDNYTLSSFKNDTLMEFLKGIHYISFTSVSINEPLYFLFSYVANFLNFLANRDCWKDPYEYSLLYSFLILFVILYNKNKNYFENLNLYEVFYICSFLCGMFIEPIISKFFLEKDKEFSTSKLLMRILYGLGAFVLIHLSKSSVVKYIFYYMLGYFICSSVIQFYSLYITRNNKENNKENNMEFDTDLKIQPL